MGNAQGHRLYITHEHHCPLYDLNDQFLIKGVALFTPARKPTCLRLAEKLKEKKRLVEIGRIEFSDLSFMCDGCGRNNSVTLSSLTQKEISEEVQRIIDCIHQFSFFKVIPSYIIEEIYDQVSIQQVDAGALIIQEGEKGHSIYVVVSGEVIVYVGDKQTPLATYRVGGIFGEMSLLSGNVCNATVETISETQLLCIKAETFYVLMERFPDLQNYFYRLLSSRFNKSNSVTATIDTSQMKGELSENPIIDVLNLLHKDKKSGRLEIQRADKKSYIDFLEGEIIAAYADNTKGVSALKILLAFFDGTYTLHPYLVDTTKKRDSLGSFMELIMESLVR